MAGDVPSAGRKARAPTGRPRQPVTHLFTPLFAWMRQSSACFWPVMLWICCITLLSIHEVVRAVSPPPAVSTAVVNQLHLLKCYYTGTPCVPPETSVSAAASPHALQVWLQPGAAAQQLQLLLWQGGGAGVGPLAGTPLLWRAVWQVSTG